MGLNIAAMALGLVSSAALIWAVLQIFHVKETIFVVAGVLVLGVFAVSYGVGIGAKMIANIYPELSTGYASSDCYADWDGRSHRVVCD